MTDRVLTTAFILTYAVLVPVLELNATHVFDPSWPAHARVHEVWQLATNSAFGAWSLWLVWIRRELRMAAGILLVITAGFLFAYLLRDGYGGSMVLSDGSEKTLFGVNLGVVVFGAAAAWSLWLLVRRVPRPPSPARTIDAS